MGPAPLSQQTDKQEDEMNDRMLRKAIEAIEAIEAAKPRTKGRIEPRSFRLEDYKPEADFFEADGVNTFHVYWGGYDYAVYERLKGLAVFVH